MTTKKNSVEETTNTNENNSSTGYNDEKRIVLWKNDNATEDNEQPSIRGQLTLNGIKYYISCWNRVDKNGKVFCQGKIRRADEMVNTTQESLF